MICELGNILPSKQRTLQGRVQNGKLYGKRMGQVNYQQKKREGYLGPGHLFFKGRELQRFYHTDILFFLWGMEKAPVAGYLIGVNQKIQLLIRLHFRGKSKLQLGQVLNLGLVLWVFSTSDDILGPWFFSLTIPLFEQIAQPEGYDQNLRHYQCHSQLRFSLSC